MVRTHSLSWKLLAHGLGMVPELWIDAGIFPRSSRVADMEWGDAGILGETVRHDWMGMLAGSSGNLL